MSWVEVAPPQVWVQPGLYLIFNNLNSSWFSVLVNGDSTGFFKSSRGLKQGDPLSPYLFILVVEALSRGFSALVQDGRVAAFSLPRGSKVISHLCFADDIVIFTKGLKNSVRELFRFLGEYERASGQKINRQKSSMVLSCRCPSSRARMLTHLTGVPKGGLPFRYLGCLLFKGRPTKRYFQHLLDKIQVSLSGWRGKFLSQGGRLILIRHVLS